MKHFFYTLICVLGLFTQANAQLADGTIAPDFTVTDIDGNTHNLYSYLNAGKHVVLDFSATWCGPCWNFHNTQTLENLQTLYGPNGSNQLMVIYLESENNNSVQCLYGNGGACTGVYPNSSQGNWVAGTPYPLVDLSSQGQNGVKAQYSIGYYPTLYGINQNTNKVYEIGQDPLSVWESWLFGSFEMAVSLSVVNTDPCPATASITANVTAGAAPISYAWSNGANTATISNLAPGNYKCTVSDANGFQFVTPVTNISGVPIITTTLVNQTNVNCSGETNGSLLVDANGGNGNFSFTWSNDQTGPEILNLAAGSYTCTATDDLGCSKTMGPYNITQPPLLLATTVNVNPACGQSNGMITVNRSGGTSPFQYTLNTVTQNTPIFSNLAGGAYNYVVTDSKGCVFTNSTALNLSTIPTALASSVGNISCTNATAQVSGTGSTTGSNMSYLWTTNDGTIISGATSLVAVVGQAGTYQLAVRNNTNDCMASSSTPMTSNTVLPTATVATPGSVTCTTTSLNLDGTASSTGNDFTYLWTTTNGNITAGATTLTPTVNQGGAYNLLVTNTTNGCVKNAAADVATNTTAPTLSLPASIQLTCTQSTAEICATSNAASYAWSNGGSQACTTAITAGTFTLTATGANGCTAQASTAVTASNDLPVVAVATPGQLTCTVANITLQGTVSTPGTYAYLWTTTNGTIVSGADSPNAVVSAGGSYNLRATNTTSGCIGNQAVTVEQLSAAPSPVFTSTTSGSSVTGTANTIATTTSFAWTLNGTNVGTGSTVTVNPTAPGVYNLCLNATNDCGTNMSCGEFTVAAVLTGAATSTDARCNGGSDGTAVATANGGVTPYSYAWTGPNGYTSTNGSIIGLSSGNYACIITDGLGAIATAQATVGQPTALAVQSQSVTDDTNNSGQGAIQLAIQGGTGTYTYLWSNGQTTANLTNIPAGSYTCVVTDANGCARNVGPIVVANVSSVDETKFVKSISVYPNPATTMLRLDVSFKSATQSSVALVNALGQIVITKSYTSTTITDTYDVSALPAGIYNLSISNGEFTTLRKIIIAK